MKLLAECCIYLRFFIFQYGKNIVLLEMITAIDTQCIKHKHELGNLITNNLYLCVFEAKHVLNRVLRQKSVSFTWALTLDFTNR